jgi:hypothetical protein
MAAEQANKLKQVFDAIDPCIKKYMMDYRIKGAYRLYTLFQRKNKKRLCYSTHMVMQSLCRV